MVTFSRVLRRATKYVDYMYIAFYRLINPLCLCTGGKSKGHIKRGNRFATDFCIRKRISTNRD